MAQQQQQRRGRTFVTAAVIFHTHIQPGVQLRASVCVCVCQQKDKVTLRFIVVGPFFWSLARVALNSLARTYINMYIYMYIQLHISPDSSLRVWRVKKWSALFFILLSRQLTHKRDLTQPHTFFNKFIGRKKWYLIVCLELFSALGGD